ncbi:helix-turn-helix domain-containing protein [Sphingomonas sanguinis]|uniref:HTH luxR-type domain-containing protein n=1 Tax=Sphingomonas sanguinis TaxID=33051 RepID=A0A147HS43_9SPHN|nr:helix-turn-helix transcriptional regulator [Sphingomonas sanguinis]KTT67086.1 hypothetical protein NS319_17395 [Sphingomonas sanguinis]
MENRAEDRFDKLSERQRECLRLVFQHRKSAEIAALLGLSARYVDNLLIEAKNIVDVSSRAEAAVLFAAYESGVESSHPVINPATQASIWPLPMPVPNSTSPVNHLTWRQVLAWVWIIAIAAPVGMMTTAMAVLALMFVFGTKPT